MSSFPTTLFAGKRFYVVGLGKNGLPAAQALTAMGAEVAVWDDNPATRAASGLTLHDPANPGFAFDALVLSPGIPHLLPQPHPAAERAREAGVPILCDVELLYQAVRLAGSRARFVGITGTNGKSTTTAMLAHVLQDAGVTAVAGANLGPAALSLPLLPHDGVYVLELSSYMLERLATVRFDAAVMLNLSYDHLDRHGDMAGYARTKQAIFDRQAADDLAVVGIDDDWSCDLARTIGPGQRVTISGFQPADVWCDEGLLRDNVGAIMRMRDAVALPGAHNAQNAAAVAAVAIFLGVCRKNVAHGMMDFPGLPHRQQKVAVADGVTFINDSKATNADSAARALGCHDRVIWIAGGMAKEGGIEPLVEYFPRVARAMLIGRDAPILAETLAAHGVRHEMVETLEAAVTTGFAAAKAEDAPVVLLSPACASWDQFTGYDQRGDRFADLARGLAEGKAA
jgi:UDP-N-acetylmuramoylalanine--D-glutamate ligase